MATGNATSLPNGLWTAAGGRVELRRIRPSRVQSVFPALPQMSSDLCLKWDGGPVAAISQLLCLRDVQLPERIPAEDNRNHQVYSRHCDNPSILIMSLLYRWICPSNHIEIRFNKTRFVSILRNRYFGNEF